ncbi:benenodin family lasso peptide [Sphingomonas sp. 1185]
MKNDENLNNELVTELGAATTETQGAGTLIPEDVGGRNAMGISED